MTRLTVLGCAGSYPGPGSPCSGYLVQGAGAVVALDLGPGTLANLQQHVAADRLDAVVLSHSHPDHWTDLAGLATMWKYRYGREGLPVYGTPENRAKAACLLGELEPTLDWRDIADAGSVAVGGLRFDFSATDHYVDTLAVRVSGDGTTWAYSADTGPSWSFATFGTGLAFALCESTNLAAAEGDGVLHLSARQAGEMSRAAAVERLVLTHLLPGIAPEAYRAEGSAAFGRPVDVAHVHATYDV